MKSQEAVKVFHFLIVTEVHVMMVLEKYENKGLKTTVATTTTDAGLSSFLKITLLCGSAGGRVGCEYLEGEKKKVQKVCHIKMKGFPNSATSYKVKHCSVLRNSTLWALNFVVNLSKLSF